MNDGRRWLWLGVGLSVGILAAVWYAGQQPRAAAGNNDRYDDYILCTGSVASNPKAPTDGVWLLDYRAGKLLGTVVDRAVGKIVGWAELDLVTEFNLPPRQNVHFLMTTGQIAKGQSALYLAETTTGKFAVYSMGVSLSNQPQVYIRRHDLALFRQTAKK
ncbi:MAG TPA: hypothetical protein VMG10_02260 [Gemmataceae bacterium]|nr:hypothetical protein [Gemmataceae bacterium]